MDASLLADEPSRLNVSVQVANDETTTAAPKSPHDDEPPYSFAYELRYFFYKGVPLGLSSILEWGVPPLFAMVMAGHATDSATLQASLGFARVFYNTTQIMVIVALSNYFATVVPGCLGAGRKDRLPNYFYRSLLLSFVVLTPLCILNLFAGELTAALGVAPELAEGVGVYCRLMVVTSYAAQFWRNSAQLEPQFSGAPSVLSGTCSSSRSIWRSPSSTSASRAARPSTRCSPASASTASVHTSSSCAGASAAPAPRTSRLPSRPRASPCGLFSPSGTACGARCS